MADYYYFMYEEFIYSMYYDDVDYINNEHSSINNIANVTEPNLNGYQTNNGPLDIYYHKIYPFEVPILGYLLPTLIFLMTMMNCFVVGIFLRYRNKKPTTILFLSIAISDTLAGLAAVPGSIFVFGLERNQLTLHICRLIFMLRLYVFPVFHTVSIWQTLGLGCLRYICVCHPFSFKIWCTIKKTVAAIAIFYIMALCIHSFHLVEEKTHTRANISICTWMIEKPCSGSCAYIWITVLLIHILPCALLAVMTAMTIYTMRKSAIQMENTNCNKESIKWRWKQDRQINIMVVSIAIAFLIPELSNGIFDLIFMVHYSINGDILPHEIRRLARAIYMVLLVVSFNFNFWVYCCMIKNFRKTVLRVLTCFYVKREYQRKRNLSSRLSIQSSRSPTSNTTNFRVTTHLSLVK